MKAHEYSFCPECGHKLEGDEFLCPSCGFKLAEHPPVAAPPVVEPTPPPALHDDSFVPPPPPVSEVVTPPVVETPVVPEPPVVEPPVVPDPIVPPVEQPVAPPPPVQEVIPPVVPVPPVAETVTPPAPQAQPVSYQPAPQQQQPAKPKKKSKAWLVILLVVLGIIIIGGGVGAFLIYNGTIPRDKVEFIPEQILEKISPKPAPVVSAPAKAFYVTYSFTLIDNKKVAIVSSVMEPSFPEKSNVEGAESAFLEFARINYSKDYFKFTSNLTTKKFDNKEKALDERENIKNDFKKKGYELRLMEVQYSVK